jgi:hypothetical protein
VGFVDTSLVEIPGIKRDGCGACGKWRSGGNQDITTILWGNTKPVKGGQKEEDNWIRLQW